MILDYSICIQSNNFGRDCGHLITHCIMTSECYLLFIRTQHSFTNIFSISRFCLTSSLCRLTACLLALENNTSMYTLMVTFCTSGSHPRNHVDIPGVLYVQVVDLGWNNGHGQQNRDLFTTDPSSHTTTLGSFYSLFWQEALPLVVIFDSNNSNKLFPSAHSKIPL